MLDEKLLDEAIMAGFQDTVFGKEAGWAEFSEGMKIMGRGIKSSLKSEEPMYRANMKARKSSAKTEKPVDKPADKKSDPTSKPDDLPPNDTSKDKNWKHWAGYTAAGVGLAGAGGAGGYYFGNKKGKDEMFNQLTQPQEMM